MNPLMKIPGVGKSIAADLNGIGIFAVSELQNQNPEDLYIRLCKKEGVRLDPCVLYTMRCAVYYASTKNPKPELLKWWNWKDKILE